MFGQQQTKEPKQTWKMLHDGNLLKVIELSETPTSEELIIIDNILAKGFTIKHVRGTSTRNLPQFILEKIR